MGSPGRPAAVQRDAERIEAEARLDGVYVLRTSEPATQLTTEDTVRTYKGLADVERRVRAHLFVCLLAGYVEWHRRRVLAPLLFEDETLHEARRTRDPVAPAKPTKRAREKKARRRTDDGLALHSLDACPNHQMVAHPGDHELRARVNFAHTPAEKNVVRAAFDARPAPHGLYDPLCARGVIAPG